MTQNAAPYSIVRQNLILAMTDAQTDHWSECRLHIVKAASALGLHVSAQPAAQQPSDLVKRLREAAETAISARAKFDRHGRQPGNDASYEEWNRLMVASDEARQRLSDLTTPAVIIEALEAAAAQQPQSEILPRCSHGNCLMDGAAELLEPSCGCRITPPAAAQPSREAALVKAARAISETADGIYIEVSDQEAEHLRETFGELDKALAAYDTPAKDERREEAK